MTAASGAAAYVAQHVKEALANDPRTGELGLDVLARDDVLVVRGVVGSEERRRAVTSVAAEVAPGVEIVNETVVKEVRPPPEDEESIS